MYHPPFYSLLIQKYDYVIYFLTSSLQKRKERKKEKQKERRKKKKQILCGGHVCP
jgi:hypothetical protein